MKTRNFGIIWMALILVIAFSSCDEFGICERGEGSVVTQSIAVPEFSGFELKIAGNVYVSQGETQSVEIEGQQNIIDLLETDTNGDVWKIKFRQCVNNYDKLNIHITVPSLNYAKISGAGDVIGQTLFDQSDRLELRISGAGNIKLDANTADLITKVTGSGDMDLNVEATSVDSEITGSGNIRLQGITDMLNAEVTGSGDIKAFGLDSKDCVVKIRGAGNADVSTQNHLDVKISGSGDVRYKGNPTLSVNITGSGKVKNAN